MEIKTNGGNEMPRTITEIQADIDRMSARAANIWTKQESRKWSDDWKALQAELKKAQEG